MSSLVLGYIYFLHTCVPSLTYVFEFGYKSRQDKKGGGESSVERACGDYGLPFALASLSTGAEGLATMNKHLTARSYLDGSLATT